MRCVDDIRTVRNEMLPVVHHAHAAGLEARLRVGLEELLLRRELRHVRRAVEVDPDNDVEPRRERVLRVQAVDHSAEQGLTALPDPQGLS